ncbi:hypothetical protein NE237_016452 [Protea cynaroides]|uniref:Uncharacterized protein n=1 Tax=Protea cynaroides TaxID=273540 RepID=A0A9Q0HE17_9MAGN|nr:hypothetical protein NE237_016452 [Protea cynaroides]
MDHLTRWHVSPPKKKTEKYYPTWHTPGYSSRDRTVNGYAVRHDILSSATYDDFSSNRTTQQIREESFGSSVFWTLSVVFSFKRAGLNAHKSFASFERLMQYDLCLQMMVFLCGKDLDKGAEDLGVALEILSFVF